MDNPLARKFRAKKIKLISMSPRRKELLSILGVPFLQINFSIDERTENISVFDLAGNLAQQKAIAYQDYYQLNKSDIIIAADTIVILHNKFLGKPYDIKEAKDFLYLLSGKKHKVVTGVALMSLEKKVVFQETTEVTFKTLVPEEIDYYVTQFQPLDKAGAYGIQEWIGAVGIDKIEGSYFNVMGLPVHRLYREMMLF
ncbi:MAG TPA: septum formation protein Maf [Bacteroidales bacterium]|nr:septum formation protein Maf [Bacteroidales bacterium]